MSPTNRSIVATRLRVLRAHHPEVTQVVLAEKLGRSQNFVHRCEKGTAQPDASDIVGICDLFGVSADYLLGRSDSTTGISPGMWMLDLDAIERPEPGRDWAVEVPRRHRFVDHREKERIKTHTKGKA